MPDPRARVMELIFGRWRSQVLYAGVKLGVFDALREGPRKAAELADELGLDRAFAFRLFRALGSLGLLDQGPDRTFSLTEAGELLCEDHPRSLRGVTLLEEGPEHYAIWRHLPDIVRDGGDDGFLREFGHSAFEHAEEDPGYADVFDDAMSSYSAMQTAWALEVFEDVDLADASHICDVGGGRGHLIASLLASYPDLRGTVLERPPVIADGSRLWAGRMGVDDRCEFVAGDMFEEVPEADVYVMKMILHDWDDDECVRILDNCQQAARDDARLYAFEHIVPDPERAHFSKLFDIHMMVWGTGRERTADEYGALFERSGWEYAGTRFPEARLMGAVEGFAG